MHEMERGQIILGWGSPLILAPRSQLSCHCLESHWWQEQVAHLVDFTIKTQCLDSCSINVAVMSLFTEEKAERSYLFTEEKAERSYRITPLSHNLRPVSLPVSFDTPPKEFQHFLC